jgi:DNA primase
MSDFQSALQARLARNAELAEEREQAEQEMERVTAERQAAQERAARELRQAQRTRHAELVEALSAAAQGLKAASPEAFVVRLGWTESKEEYIAKISTRLLEPGRSLLIELDRDDDEVLARWHSDVGNSLELWRLLEVEPPLLEALVLQVADQQVWRGRSSPPPFP